MSLFPAPMRRVTAVVLDADAAAVTRELLRVGVLHFVAISHGQGSWGAGLDSLKPGTEEGRIADTRKRIESFLGLVGSRPPPPLETALDGIRPLDLDRANADLDGLAGALQEAREKQRLAQQEILRYQEIRRHVDFLGDLTGSLPPTRATSFLSIRAGTLPTARAPDLESRLAALPTVLVRLGEAEGGLRALLLFLKRDEPSVAAALAETGWAETDLPRQAEGKAPSTGGEVRSSLDARLRDLEAQQRSHGEKVTTLVGSRREELERMWSQVRVNELYARIQGYFSRTARTVIFSGWLPRDRQRDLDEAVRKATGGRCYVEWSTPRRLTPTEQGAIPVKLTNPRLLRPFQRLVENYSVPQYGTVDPTPLVVVAYLCMFGLMFADLGQGAVLALVGLLGILRARSRGQPPGVIVQLLVWCGAASMVTGLLFGSVFGRPWIRPLWFDYHGAVFGGARGGLVRDVYGILTITLYFGIAVIGIGLLLNWLSLVRRRRWLQLVLDKGGIVGGWMYGAGVWAASSFADSGFRTLPPSGLLAVLFGAPALLLLAKAPLEMAAEARKHGRRRSLRPMMLVDFLMAWIVEILEIFSGYLANTLSFLRVAGLGIGHVSLGAAFTEIASMISGGGTWGIGSVAVYVIGNALVIGLEGLSAGIQSLRLNYYEFFTKYFVGDGKAYAPVSLRPQ